MTQKLTMSTNSQQLCETMSGSPQLTRKSNFDVANKADLSVNSEKTNTL